MPLTSPSPRQTIRRAKMHVLRVQRLVERAEAAAEKNDDATLASVLGQLARVLPPPTLKANTLRSPEARTRRQLRSVYATLRKMVKVAHDYFRDSFTGVHKKVTQADVDTFLAKHPNMERLAPLVGAAWTPKLATDVGEQEPGKWVIARLAAEAGVSAQTLRNHLFRRKKHAAVK